MRLALAAVGRLFRWRLDCVDLCLKGQNGLSCSQNLKDQRDCPDLGSGRVGMIGSTCLHGVT